MTFARTKIQPPRPRVADVERGPLQTRLADALLHKRLVLLCAPAGYGKTTLLAQGLAQLPEGTPVAWVAADAGDDLTRLLECMLAALEPFDPPWRAAPESLVRRVASSFDEKRLVAAEIINTLDACAVAHGVIAFDDLHRVEDPAFFQFLDVLIERLGSHWTIAITSRMDPALALARLRGRDEIAEFRQLQLQFARSEARELASRAGVAAAAADRLFDRTQGWPAALRIAFGAVQGGASGSAGTLRASERPLFEFFVAEVIEQLPPKLADFLVAASVLPELDAERCVAVTGDSQAALRLAEIERLGLCVDELDAPTRTLRLHDLVRDALLARLSHLDPQRFAMLRRRAAETEPDPIRRIGWLLQAGELAAAEQLAIDALPAMIVTAGPAAALHVVAQFPAAARDRAPELGYVRALANWAQSWDFQAMNTLMDQAARAFAQRGDTAREQAALAHASIALIGLGRMAEAGQLITRLRSQTLVPEAEAIVLNAEAWYAIDVCRYRDVAPLRARLLDLLQQVGRIELWYHTTPPLRMPGLPGMTAVLERHAALMLEVAGDAPTPLRAIALHTQAWCALWRGRIDEARRFIASARDEAQWIGQTRAVHAHLLTLAAAIAVITGDADQALDAIAERLRSFSPSGGPFQRYNLLVSGARFAAGVDRREALREALQQAAVVWPRDVDAALRRPRELPLEAQLAWLEGRRDQAIAAWQQSLAIEDRIDVLGLAADVRVRLAHALVERGDLRGAANVLVPLFERAHIEGPGGVLLAADPLRALAAVDWRDTLAAEQQVELRAWWALVAEARGKLGLPAVPTGPLGDALSTRETEVLARIAAGDSNKLIARALDLSLHTVKRHVANILSKLNVETRGQAAAWYRKHRAAAAR